MTVLAWSSALQLHQPEMDRTHAEFVEHLQALEQALDADLVAIDVAFAALLEHTRQHFAQEERWLVDLGFTPANCHAYQHAHVLNVLAEVRGTVQAAHDTAAARQLVTELANWVPVHAQTMDAGLAQLMTERGYDPATGALLEPVGPGAAPLSGCGSSACG